MNQNTRNLNAIREKAQEAFSLAAQEDRQRRKDNRRFWAPLIIGSAIALAGVGVAAARFYLVYTAK